MRLSPINWHGIQLEEGQAELKIYTTSKGLFVISTVDNTPKWGNLLHISISHKLRIPTWDEMIEIKNQLFGDIDAMMVMPKKIDYVSLHKNCFHIWQCPQEWGIR